MIEERVQRKLAAILAADVVSYSRMMEADETGTLDRLKSVRRELFAPIIAEFGGRIFKTTGDGAFVEFKSAVDAVRSASDIQEALAEYNDGVPEDQRILLRIGISLGDVIVEGNDLYGNGVNVASRIESTVGPGQIGLSQVVHENIRNKGGLTTMSIGSQELKGVDGAVNLYLLEV